ncbi:MAG: hypothetical protein EAZ85_04335 [Bacteroidetes bacterium]|nr:MAG: hypothetical protein EAZ85_04335 [Bacteroidota bacterium]TAG88390.1 MAG: hypothetical protein EAZ20_08685 [Bacteroidota bacterium]
MAWTCINCETNNADNVIHCQVCSVERYFSWNEVNLLIKKPSDIPIISGVNQQELKKIETNLKRFTTENKKLRENNKELNQKMKDLQIFHDTHTHTLENLQHETNELSKWNTMLKVWLGIMVLIVLFLFLAKVNIAIDF